MATNRIAPVFDSSDVSVAWLLGTAGFPCGVDPDKAALRWAGGGLSYHQLRDRALSLAGGLIDIGLGSGERVATVLPNTGEIFELYFACAYAGLTFVPIDFRLRPKELAAVLQDATPAVIVTKINLRDGVAQAARMSEQDPWLFIIDAKETRLSYASLTRHPHPTGPLPRTDPHLLLYTSGTTGTPKGVRFTHLGIMWQGMQALAFESPDCRRYVTLLTGPMSNTAAINEMSIPGFMSGGTITIMPSGGWSADSMAELIDRWSVTHTTIYPSMFLPFLEADQRRSISLSSLQFVLTGGEPCAPSILRRWRQRWSHVTVANGYGLTEGGGITQITGQELDLRPDSVGRIWGCQAMKVIDQSGQACPPGIIGEIITASPAVTDGYWDDPQLSASALVDGWLRTGDLGRIDEDGYLYLAGRARDLIISGAQNIYPAEIEAALMAHPEVGDCAVVGVPDDKFGEAVCAVVVRTAASNVSGAELVGYLKTRLASYKKPKHTVFVPKIERNAAGKVDKITLAESIVHELTTEGRLLRRDLRHDNRESS